MLNKILCAGIFFLWVGSSTAGIAVSGTLGTSRNSDNEHSFAYSVYLKKTHHLALL